MGSVKGLKKFLSSKMFSLLIILAFLVVLFTVWAAVIGNSFFTTDTLLSIVDMLVVTSFLAIGSGALLLTGNIDLSTVAIGSSGGVIFALALKTWLLPTPLALIVTLAMCAAMGLINAVLVNEFNMQPFIATMGMSSVITGFRYWISWDAASQSATNYNYSNGFTTFLGTYDVFGFIPVTVVIMAVAFLFYGILLKKTKFGDTVYLVGGNRNAARLSGLNPKRTSYILFANSAMLSGVSGIVLFARTGLASQLALTNNMFTGLTAAILGGISFFGGSGGMGGVFVGLLILNTFNKGMAIAKFDAFWTPVLTGVLLVAALSFDYNNVRKKDMSLSSKKTKAPEKEKEKAGSSR